MSTLELGRGSGALGKGHYFNRRAHVNLMEKVKQRWKGKAMKQQSVRIPRKGSAGGRDSQYKALSWEDAWLNLEAA